MGLDLSAEGSSRSPQWAYSGFMRFREKLAAAAGLPPLRDMAGFGYGQENPKQIPWDSVSTPLRPLLDHSDCEGELTWQECAQVEPELRRIVEAWDEDEPFDHDRHSGLSLADLMRHCAAAKVPLEFS